MKIYKKNHSLLFKDQKMILKQPKKEILYDLHDFKGNAKDLK